MRWIAAVLLILGGLVIAGLSVTSAGFMLIACFQSPPDWVFFILVASAVLMAITGIVPAIMLIRDAKGNRVVLVFVLGVILSCVTFGVYFAFFSNYCNQAL
jgi:K+-sensing histidine kinase KdpD